MLFSTSSITSITTGAFYECSSLTSIVVEQGNLYFSSLDGVLFNVGLSTLIQYPLGIIGNYVIPSSVTSIAGEAFQSCSLASITIPSSVTSIGEYSFSDCSGLTSIIIPNSVTSIGISAFQECSSLTSITIPSSVTNISERAFGWCSSLTATYFLGDAPTLGIGVFTNVDPNHIIYYLDSSADFTTPLWNDYPTQIIDTSTYPAASWLLESNLTYGTTLNQDLNGDGVSLLMAYALDLNPNEQLINRLPIAELDNTSLSMKYYSGSAGVTYRVEFSKDMGTWVTTGVTISAPDANGIRTASIDRGEICGFLRLAIIEG